MWPHFYKSKMIIFREHHTLHTEVEVDGRQLCPLPSPFDACLDCKIIDLTEKCMRIHLTQSVTHRSGYCPMVLRMSKLYFMKT